MFWLISAASLSGYVILAFFVIIAIARFAKHTCLALAERLPRRSRSRHHLIAWVSAAFFSLLTVRACYIAAVIVDTRFR
nr:putative membrane protein [Rhizobium rhizogenes]